MVKLMNIIEIGIEITHFGIKISLVAPWTAVSPKTDFFDFTFSGSGLPMDHRYWKYSDNAKGWYIARR